MKAVSYKSYRRTGRDATLVITSQVRNTYKRFKKLKTLEKYYNKLNRGDLYDDYSIDCA